MFRVAAWGGICLRVPEDWEPGRIGRDSLLLERGGRPILEAGWRRERPDLDLERAFERARRSVRKARSEEWEPLGDAAAEADWRKPLAAFRVKPFSWAAARSRGRGGLVHCPACGMVTLLRFHDSSEADEARRPAILSSFRDHRDDGLIERALFDLRLLAPDSLRLETWEFRPGRFRLALRGKGALVRCERLAPADALLRSSGLRDMAESLFGPLGDRVREDDQGLDWTREARGGWLGLRRLVGRQGAAFGRLWHVEEANRLFGLEATFDRRPDQALFERLCDGFGAH